MPPPDLQARRDRRLRRQVAWARRRSPFYRRHLAAAPPASRLSLADLSALPLLERHHLAERMEDLWCVSRARWADVSRTSGTTGKAVYIPVTHRELRRTVRYVAEGMRATGLGPGEAVMMLFPMDDLMNPTVVLEQVIRDRFQALLLRVGALPPPIQAERLRALRPTAVVGAPGPFLRLGRALEEAGLPPRQAGVRRAILMGQPLYGAGWVPNGLHRALTELWGCEIFDVYGATELYAGMCECAVHAGHHLPWEHMAAEIVDPDTGLPVTSGTGELVLTTLTREALPLIRYRTGDITWLEEEPCACGQSSPRVMAILGRTDEMLKIHGARLYPQQVEDALESVEGVLGHVLEVRRDEAGQDLLCLRLAVAGEAAGVVSEVRRRVREATRVTPRVEVVGMDEVQRLWFAHGGRKPRKFHDLRRPG